MPAPLASSSQRQPRRPARPLPTSQSDIEEVAEAVIHYKLAGTAGAKTRESQLRSAIRTIREVKCAGKRGQRITVADVTLDDLQHCVSIWRCDPYNLKPSTINSRLTVLSLLGIDCRGAWLPVRLPPKWWLSPDKLAVLLTWLRGPEAKPIPPAHAALMADYVEFVVWTGLRVGEALRLTWRDVRLDLRAGAEEGGAILNHSEITVPGTKTTRAQASLSIALVPALVLQRRYAEASDKGGLVFPITYEHMHNAWEHCRAFLGESADHLATLRALRRTAARYLTTNGMPTEMLRQYLRHNNIETTMGYLRLVGGYSTAEQRRWL